MITHHFDSNVTVDLLRGKRPLVDARYRAIDKLTVGISAIVVGELRVGVEKSGNQNEAQALGRFLKAFAIIRIDEAVAEEYARLRAQLERIGQRLDGNDLWIAAAALAEGATLVTADEAFNRVPSLKVENWRV